jgi:thiol-disulfide isomerase/thioredoxin
MMWRAPFILICLCVFVCGCTTERSIDEYLAQVKEIGEPDFDAARKQEPGYMDNYRREQHILYQQKAALLLEACRVHPDDERVPELMDRHWKLLAWNQDPLNVAGEVLTDIDTVLASDDWGPDVRQHADYWRTFFQVHKNADDPKQVFDFVTEFTGQHPDDERGAQLLSLTVTAASADTALQHKALSLLAQNYPETYYGTYAPGMIHRLTSLGEPFEFSFTDLVSGEKMSISDLRDRVVILDFWSTSCVPCVREFPHLKELYAQYHPQGVEFIGISLDEPPEKGGRQAVLKFVGEHDLPWPQYYQGNGYDSEFSKSWGVGSIPTMFAVGKEGRLRTTKARGRLDDVIPKLLAE